MTLKIVHMKKKSLKKKKKTALPMQEVWAQSLVRELRSYTPPRSIKTQNQNLIKPNKN